MNQNKLNEIKSCYEQRGYVWNDDAGWLIAEAGRLHEEAKLLRKIADETKRILDQGALQLEAIALKNLLTDRIDFDERNAPAA